ncbi:hypothetical protein PQQ99_09735 [Paraburkholderia sediminicola]|uniref:hypothetical protein n=1 Tax=Paraburkholderia sediminicola TaxID=458836 RepID=UPI0038B84C82
MPGVNSLSAVGLSRVLSSDWGGLNPALIAKFYPLKRVQSGGGWEQSRDTRELAKDFTVDDGFEVHCPITDGTQETSFNWHSPFEGAGAESKAPTLSAMLQSGSLTPVIEAFITKNGVNSTSSEKALEALAQARGRTGITKLNSTQTFTGMPPVKLSVTLHFRAVTDPKSEVRDPISQLEQWAVPQFLADDGLIAGAVKSGGEDGILQTIYPSVTPQILAMKYGDMLFQPMVIESLSKPITNPRDASGVMISCSVQATICSLVAWDRRDIKKLYL